jgi:hypothetical protein
LSEKEVGRLAEVVKGVCWSFIKVGGVPIGCDHCGEVETPKADKAFLEKIEKINTAADRWRDEAVEKATTAEHGLYIDAIQKVKAEKMEETDTAVREAVREALKENGVAKGRAFAWLRDEIEKTTGIPCMAMTPDKAIIEFRDKAVREALERAAKVAEGSRNPVKYYSAEMIAAAIRKLADEGVGVEKTGGLCGPGDIERLGCRSCGKLWDGHEGILGTCAKLKAALRERDEARKALKKYGKHEPLCAAVGGYGYCSCGIEKALLPGRDLQNGG